MRDVLNIIRRSFSRLRELPPLRKELIILAASLLFAVLVLLPLIWVAGQLFLGDYIRSPSGTPTGGPMALILDFLRGVFALSPGYWFVLLGPYLLLWALRACRAVLKM